VRRSNATRPPITVTITSPERSSSTTSPTAPGATQPRSASPRTSAAVADAAASAAGSDSPAQVPRLRTARSSDSVLPASLPSASRTPVPPPTSPGAPRAATAHQDLGRPGHDRGQPGGDTPPGQLRRHLPQPLGLGRQVDPPGAVALEVDEAGGHQQAGGLDRRSHVRAGRGDRAPGDRQDVVPTGRTNHGTLGPGTDRTVVATPGPAVYRLGCANVGDAADDAAADDRHVRGHAAGGSQHGTARDRQRGVARHEPAD
jgi:hypothetical protein